MHTYPRLQIASRLRKTAHDLGYASIDLVHSSASLQGEPDNQAFRQELADNAKVITEKVSQSPLQYLSWLLCMYQNSGCVPLKAEVCSTNLMFSGLAPV